MTGGTDEWEGLDLPDPRTEDYAEPAVAPVVRWAAWLLVPLMMATLVGGLLSLIFGVPLEPAPARPAPDRRSSR